MKFRKERMFLVLMVLVTVAYLVIMAIRFTTVPVVEAKETVLEETVILETTSLETAVIEVHTVKHAHTAETPIAGFALVDTESLTAYYDIQTEKDLYLLAKLIHAEAGIDNMAGKLAVGTVVMNRANHWNHKVYGGPTLEGVINHKLGKYHVFSCVDDEGLWAEEPNEVDFEAARKILIEGYRSFNSDYLYYHNPDLSKGTRGVKYDTEKIGMHKFGVEQ